MVKSDEMYGDLPVEIAYLQAQSRYRIYHQVDEKNLGCDLRASVPPAGDGMTLHR